MLTEYFTPMRGGLILNYLLSRVCCAGRNRSTAGPHRGPYQPVLLALMLVLVLAAAAQACPMCAEAVGNQSGSDSSGMVSGYFWSILFMMSMPFALFGGFTALVVRAYRKQETVEQEEPPLTAAVW